MRIPTERECFRLIGEMNMMDHIVDHSVQVSRVALFLVDHMDRRTVVLNRRLVLASALLHDITKTRSFDTQENHATTGAQFLYDCGYRHVGDVVRQHVRLNEYFISRLPNEAEIVNYADKRVLHDRIVPLKDRMAYILKKYGQAIENQQRIQWLWEKTEALEKRLFTYLPFSPSELGKLMAGEAKPANR